MTEMERLAKEVKASSESLCEHKRTKLVNYDMAMHDGDIVCADCGKFIRYWDAG